MKFARLLGLAVFLMLGATYVFAAEDEIRYVKVKEPFKNIYVNMDPKSEIIRQTKKGEFLELLRDGVSWYEVKVDGKVGLLEARHGKIVNRKGESLITLFLYLLVLAGCLGGVTLYIKKQQQLAANASGDRGLDSFSDPDDDLDD